MLIAEAFLKTLVKVYLW